MWIWGWEYRAGPWFNIKVTSCQYRKSHCGDKTILRPSYLHNGISYTGEMTSLYWIKAQVSMKSGLLNGLLLTPLNPLHLCPKCGGTLRGDPPDSPCPGVLGAPATWYICLSVCPSVTQISLFLVSSHLNETYTRHSNGMLVACTCSGQKLRDQGPTHRSFIFLCPHHSSLPI